MHRGDKIRQTKIGAMKAECAELLLVDYSVIAGLKTTNQNRHQGQEVFPKTKTTTSDLKTKTKSMNKTRKCASRPSRDQEMSPDFPPLLATDDIPNVKAGKLLRAFVAALILTELQQKAR